MSAQKKAAAKKPAKKGTERNSTALKKKAVLAQLEKTLGVVTPALRALDLSRTNFYRWLKDDPDFAADVEAVGDITIDFAESQLHKQIKDGNTTATIFFLKTKGKKRGYVEKQQVEVSGGETPIVIDLNKYM